MKARARNTARQAADRLMNVSKTQALAEVLTPEEYDWLELLRERLYAIGRGRL